MRKRWTDKEAASRWEKVRIKKIEMEPDDPEDEVGQVRAMFRAVITGLILTLVSASFTVYFFLKWLTWI